MPTFNKREEIPEGFSEFYAEKDGKWQPIPVDDGAALKETLRKEREARSDAEKERGKLERKLAAAESGDEKDKVSKALAKFDDDLATEKERHRKELEKVQGELRTLKLDDQAKAAFIKAGGRPERAEAALKLKKDALDLAEDRIVVKDAKGEVTSASIDDFWGKTFRAEMPDFYVGTKADGGGASGGASRSQTVASPGAWDADAIMKDPLGAVNAANMAQTK